MPVVSAGRMHRLCTFPRSRGHREPQCVHTHIPVVSANGVVGGCACVCTCSYAKSEACLLQQFQGASASSASSTGHAITGSGNRLFVPRTCFASFSLCLSYPSFRGGVSKPNPLRKYIQERKMNVLWWGMTRRHEYLSRPLSSGSLPLSAWLVSATKLRDVRGVQEVACIPWMSRRHSVEWRSLHCQGANNVRLTSSKWVKTLQDSKWQFNFWLNLI